MKEFTQQPGLFGQIPAKSFHNTIDLKGEEHISAEKAAKALEAGVLKLFADIKIMSPRETHKMYELRYNKKVLLTSIRRAISNLTDDNKLIKTKVKRKSFSKWREGVWKFNEEPPPSPVGEPVPLLVIKRKLEKRIAKLEQEIEKAKEKLKKYEQ